MNTASLFERAMTSERWLRASATLTMDMDPVYILDLEMYMNTAPTRTLSGRGLDGTLYAETMQQPSSIMAQYLARWDVTQSGSAFSTPSSELVPGIKYAVPVMLKVALIDEEA